MPLTKLPIASLACRTHCAGPMHRHYDTPFGFVKLPLGVLQQFLGAELSGSRSGFTGQALIVLPLSATA